MSFLKKPGVKAALVAFVILGSGLNVAVSVIRPPIRCVIMGDSIANLLGWAAQECVTIAVSGITSEDYTKRFPGLIETPLAVISIGTNDLGGPAMTNNVVVDPAPKIALLRSRVHATHVVWLRPSLIAPASVAAVDKVSAEHGDAVIDIAAEAWRGDAIHPTQAGMERIAAALQIGVSR